MDDGGFVRGGWPVPSIACGTRRRARRRCAWCGRRGRKGTRACLCPRVRAWPLLVLLDGDLAGEPAPWAVPVPRAPGMPLCRRAPRPVSSRAVRPGRTRASISIMGDDTGASPSARLHDNDQRTQPPTTAWILVPAPTPWPGRSTSRFPQLRPAPCAAGPVGPTLVGADNARVHAHPPVKAAILTGPGHQGSVDGVQRTVPRPGAVTFPHRPPRPIALGRTTPRHPRTAGRHPQNLAVTTTRPAPHRPSRR